MRELVLDSTLQPLMPVSAPTTPKTLNHRVRSTTCPARFICTTYSNTGYPNSRPQNRRHSGSQWADMDMPGPGMISVAGKQSNAHLLVARVPFNLGGFKEFRLDTTAFLECCAKQPCSGRSKAVPRDRDRLPESWLSI